MKNGFVDSNLIQNSTLSCFLLASFVFEYEKLTAKTSSPDLLKLLLVLPIVWHKESCDAVKGRAFSTPLLAVLAECPAIKNNFRERVEAFAPIGCQGLNLACSAGLLKKVASHDEPCISALFDKWPQGSRPTNIPSEMRLAIPRLAMWFKDAKTAQLYSQFLGV